METDSLKNLLRNLIYQNDQDSQLTVLTKLITTNVVGESISNWLKFTILPQINIDVITNVVKNIGEEYASGDFSVKTAILKHIDRFLKLTPQVDVRSAFISSVVESLSELNDDLLKEGSETVKEYTISLIALLAYVSKYDLIFHEDWAKYQPILDYKFRMLNEYDFGEDQAEINDLLAEINSYWTP